MRVTCGDLLLEGLRLSTHKQDEHGNLRGSSHRSVIPYVHGREGCITVCVTLFNTELNLHRVDVVLI
jgi:hypothetical protein